MVKSGRSGPPASPIDPAVDPEGLIAALRQQAADQIDPVRFRYLEALARRTLTYRGGARRVLDDKLDKALTEYRERFAEAQDDAGDIIGRIAEYFPEAADEARRLFDAGDFRGLSRFVASLENHGDPAPLTALLSDIAQPAAADVDEDSPGNSSAPGELKSLRQFRATWSKLSVDRQLIEAMAQGPANAGPLNSHRLVLQSLELLRDLSPDYLNCFMSYADALLWLDRANGGRAPTEQELARGDNDRKRKAARSRPR